MWRTNRSLSKIKTDKVVIKIQQPCRRDLVLECNVGTCLIVGAVYYLGAKRHIQYYGRSDRKVQSLTSEGEKFQFKL